MQQEMQQKHEAKWRMVSLLPDWPAERCCLILHEQSNILDPGGGQEGHNKQNQSAGTAECFTEWFTSALSQEQNMCLW